MSQHGRISSRYLSNKLNEVDDSLIDILSGDILMELEYKAGKEAVIALRTVIARENNCGSITSAQKAGRATAGSRSEPVVASGGDITDAIATATDAITGVANVLANSPVRQRRWRLDPSPDRRPEPAKKAWKRKDREVDDVGEVDLRPRKLWSRK
jgi:hypothetical protein